MENRENVTIGPIFAYVINFDAATPYPQRFTYLACSQLALNTNMPCLKTINGPYKCSHDSLEMGTWIDAYRFDVFLVDGSIGQDCPPLRAGIFDAAKTLLNNRSPGDFSLMEEDTQVATVKGVINKMPFVYVWVRVFDCRLTIQRLAFVDTVKRQTPGAYRKKIALVSMTPLSDADSYSTPTSTLSGSFYAGSSSRHVDVNPTEFQTLKERVKEMESMIRNMHGDWKEGVD
ncbi:unnamed protein product [Calypogeia fissa]